MEGGDAVDAAERERRSADAHLLLTPLHDRRVIAVAVTWVDNSGITRVKAVPLAKLPFAAAWGIGASPVFDAFLADDSIVAGRYAGGPVGDLRLHPDLSRITVLAEQPGWAWAPADRFQQDGQVHPLDQRSLARRAVAALGNAGFTARLAFEVEWAVGMASDDFAPAATGPAYGYARLMAESTYIRELLIALDAQGITVDQVHPEYAAGQFEISVAAEDPVGGADTFVLVRETIRALSLRHGVRASFSPKVLADGVGNGGHVHVSLWSADRNLFTGGDRVCGLTRDGEAFSAGILHHLPALLAVGAPSVASYLRLIPSQWAGAYHAWGLENRETAVRLIQGSAGNEPSAANLEVKAFDESANPYLVVAGLLYAGLAGMSAGASLPPQVDVDPASLSDQERARRGIARLPTSLEQAAAAFEADVTLTEAFGEPLAATIVDVRRAEAERFADATPEEVAAALRWTY
jgi:glutamine synthetase